ncbi:MAG: DpnI domain-containing protein, partial [Candidatus Tumulicola sp.]
KAYASAAEQGVFPNLVLVEWDSRFSCVFVVRAIRGTAITKQHVIPRNALSEHARRAGWRGCVIDVGGLPSVGLVTPQLRDPEECRSDWRAQPL